MKLFSQTFFLCFFVVLSLEFLDSVSAAKFRGYVNASNDSGTLSDNVRENRSSDAMLLSDEIHGKEDKEDVVLSGTGLINLTLIHEMLKFEVCNNCAGTSRVCYESWNGWEDSDAIGSCSVPNSCEFKVKDDGDGIYFGKHRVFKSRFIPSTDGSCLSTMMKYPLAEVLPTHDYKSCDPKMDDNKMVKLFVFIDPRCSIKVINAKIHLPALSLSTTKVPPPTLSSQKGSAEATSFPDWGYIIIGIVILIAIALFIGVIVYYFYKKRQTSKRVSPNVVETKPKSTASKADVAADVKIPTKKDDDLEAVKIEPSQIPKKEKKTKTQEPETTEDVPAPTQMPKKNKKKPKTVEPTTAEDVPENKKKTKTLEPETTEDVPAPNVSKQELPTPASKEPTSKPPFACYPQVRRLIPRGMKSAKSDSLDETLKKDKSVMMESESVKF